MVTRYPAAIDTVFTLKPILDGQPVTGGSVEQLREAIIAIEEELGVKPSGVYATVRNRLDVIENVVGNLRIIELEGDLGGTLETPKMIGIQGRPVSDVPPVPGDALVWDGIAWVPGTQAAEVHFGGDLRGNPETQRVVGINTVPVVTGDNAFDRGFLRVRQMLDFSKGIHFDGVDLWVTSFNNDLVRINPAGAGTIVNTMTLPQTYYGGYYIDSDSTHVFVTSFGYNVVGPTTFPQGHVHIIEKATNNIVGVIDSAFASGNVFGLAINGDEIFVGSGEQELSYTFTADNVSQVDRYSKAQVLAAYPASGAPVQTLPPSPGTAYNGGMCFGAGFLFVTGYTNGYIYKIDPATMTVVEQYVTDTPGTMSDPTFAFGSVYVPNNNIPGMFRFNPLDLTDKISIFGPFGRFCRADTDSIWETDDNSSFIRRVAPDLSTFGDNDLEDGGQYGQMAFDGTYMWTCNRSSGPDGQGIYAMGRFPGYGAAINHFFGGKLEIAYDPGPVIPPAAPFSTLIYRPSGGINFGNIFSSWTNLMATRDTVDGPVTIFIDDTDESPALVDPGIWNAHDTKIVGIREDTALTIPSGASVQNPVEFENIICRVAKWDLSIAGIHFTGTSQLILRNAQLLAGENDLVDGKCIFFQNQYGKNNIQMFGNSVIKTDDNFSPINVGDFINAIIDMYDFSYVSDHIFVFGSSSGSNVNVYSASASLDDRQGSDSFAPNYYSNEPLIFQPDGGGPFVQRTLTTWTNVMRARSTILGPVTIIIDDSITSPAVIDIGQWDLAGTGYETELVGAKGPQVYENLLTKLHIESAAQLVNPSSFKYLYITGNPDNEGDNFTPSINCTNGFMNFEALDTFFQNISGSGHPLINTTGGTIDLLGTSRFVSSFSSNWILTDNGAFDTIVINVRDNSTIDGYCLNFSSTDITINITGRGFYTVNQPGIFVSITINQANLVQSQSYDTFNNPNIITFRPPGYAGTINQPSNGSINLASISDIGSSGDYNAILSGRDHSIEGSSNFSVIVGGEDNHITGSYSVVGGHASQAQGDSCVAFGSSVFATNFQDAAVGGISNFAAGGRSAILGGQNNGANGFSSVVLGGDQGSAGGFAAIVMAGEQSQASGDNTIAMGSFTNAFRTGQLSHGAGNFFGFSAGSSQFSRYFLLAETFDATPTIMLDFSGNGLQLQTGKTYAVEATLVATDTISNLRLMITRDLLLHCTGGGIAVIDGNNLIPNRTFNSTSWTFAITVNGGDSNVTATFTGQAGHTINAFLTYTWSEVGGGA